VRDVLVRSDDDHAPLLAIDASHLEDVGPGLEVGAEHLLVVDQAEAALSRQQDGWHSNDRKVTMPLLENGPDVDHGIDVVAARREALDRRCRGIEELAQRTDALHVFCYASRPALIARVVQREGIAADEAAKRVDETNKRREQYVRRYWHRSWHAPENYHLCVNTEWLGIDGAADLIVQVARERLA